MAEDRPDDGRRRVLRRMTVTLGGVGLTAAGVPFALSMKPSARAWAEGGPAEVDLGSIAPGWPVTVLWRRKPVWILRRTPEMLATLEADRGLLADPDSAVRSQQPDYARNSYRSIRPETLVVVGLCTHLGCVPAAHLEPGSASGLGADWPGGWFCHCHGSKFDLAGRVFKYVPAPTNLVVPPHRYEDETRLVLGEGTVPSVAKRSDVAEKRS